VLPRTSPPTSRVTWRMRTGPSRFGGSAGMRQDGIDPAQAIHHVCGRAGACTSEAGRAEARLRRTCLWARPVAGRRAPGDDGRDERAGQGRLPEGKAGPDGAVRAAPTVKRVSILRDI
jgi:hypothetical protein